MKYTDRQRLQKIYAYAVQLRTAIQEMNITREALLDNVRLQWLVTTPLYNIGEHVYCLSDDYKKAHDTVPWALIAGMRHRLVHDYDDTNWNLVVKILFEDIPALIEQLESLK